jgi:geranylgeranyl diphosphate synthase type II
MAGRADGSAVGVTADAWLTWTAERVNEALAGYFPPEGEAPRPLYQALRYAMLAPGKRFRPALVLAAARWLGLDPNSVLPAALAVEMVHTYSLVHDDLPAMDDDDWRRGRPTVHRAFSEDIAILVGDALLTEAFRVLAEQPGEPRAIVGAVRRLAEAAGHAGLVGGQVRDLHPPDRMTLEDLATLHAAKTGALIRCAAVLPAIIAGREDAIATLDAYGARVGLAFQITDDILDAVGDQAVMGKAPGRDARHGKTTYLTFYGAEEARALAAQHVEQAERLVPGPAGDALRGLARFVLARDH